MQTDRFISFFMLCSGFWNLVSIPGYPQPELKWLQNEKPVSASGRVTTEQHEDGLCTLVVADLQPSDSGVYVCRASNALGEGMCSAKLKVELWLWGGKPFWRRLDKVWTSTDGLFFTATQKAASMWFQGKKASSTITGLDNQLWTRTPRAPCFTSCSCTESSSLNVLQKQPFTIEYCLYVNV